MPFNVKDDFERPLTHALARMTATRLEPDLHAKIRRYRELEAEHKQRLLGAKREPKYIYLTCKHCYEIIGEHAGNKKCLFGATSYEPFGKLAYADLCREYDDIGHDLAAHGWTPVPK